MRLFLLAVNLCAAVAIVEAQHFGPHVYQILGRGISEVTVLDEGFGNQIVRGKPFTAVEERHSLQILRDGTRIENDQKNRIFRDSQGRARVEEMNGAATILDPAAGFRAELDPSAKIARKGFPLAVRNLLGTLPSPTAAKGVMPQTIENLRPRVVHGIMADGVRITMIIPKGRIGNDREIKVVTERWVSNDLQMLIKSTNSDPRFGDTTYELTMIHQHEADASLFQIPAGYTIMETGGRGGRSPVPGVGRNSRSPSSQ